MSQLTDEQLALINQPLVVSLLYDINLLPEQLLALGHDPGHKHWDYMLAVIGHFDMAFKERDELIDVLREYLLAATNSMQAPDDDDVAAMLRFGQADKAVRQVLAKYDETKA